MNRAVPLFLIACFVLPVVSFGVAADETKDIPTNAQETGVHNSLVDALTHAGLVEDLQAEGPFTVFAPTDQAFTDAGIDLSTFDTEEENETLSTILLHHVVQGAVDAANVTDGMVATTLSGYKVAFTVTNDSVMIDDANVTSADVMASNGIIHVIDKVLMPPGDIPTIAQDTGVHASLVEALTKADLVTALQGEGPFTVFAPTDQAFTDAGIDLSTYDTAEEIEALADILQYHVYAGAVPSGNVTDGRTVAMLNGDDATFTVTNGTVMVGGATVTIADVEASNGIIHVIDKVLMPPADEPVAVDPFEGVTCAATVGIDSSGYAFTPIVVNIAVGETVCWFWEDSSMPHNVKEVDGFKSTTYVMGGVSSGAAASTVAFHHTFTEDTTFYYACEPHIGLDMFGEVRVGNGGAEPATEDTSDSGSDDSEDTPGFLVIPTLFAMIAALVLMGRYDKQE